MTNFSLRCSDGSILSYDGSISWSKAFSTFKFHCSFFGVSGEVFCGSTFVRSIGRKEVPND